MTENIVDYPKQVEIKEGRIDWMYPDIYGEEARSVLKIALCHVRAADDIEIEYDGKRDGYVIYRTVIVGWSHPTVDRKYFDPIEKRKEVAFVPAWDEEDKSDGPEESKA